MGGHGHRDESGRQFPQTSARSLLFSLLALHVAPAGPEVATSVMVGALGHFGIADKTARQAIRRMCAHGVTRSEKRGRTALLVLTGHARDLLAERAEKADRFRKVHRDETRDHGDTAEWLVLSLSAEGIAPDLKQRLRRSLVSFGWGSLFPGVWMNCSPASYEPARELLARFGVDKTAALMRADFLAPTDIESLIARGWDLDRLAARYQAYIDRFASVTPATDLEAFVQRTLMADAWVAFDSDPLLPPAFLPAAWPGTEARQLIADRYVRWRAAAERSWERMAR